MPRPRLAAVRVSLMALVTAAVACDGSPALKPMVDSGTTPPDGAPPLADVTVPPLPDVALPEDRGFGPDATLPRMDSGAEDVPPVRPIDVRPPTDLPQIEAALPRDLMPPTMLHPRARALATGRARLVGDTLSVCSNQTTGSFSADRWCAFTLPYRLPGRTELWVINATKAIAGTPVKCDPNAPTADPNCKLLTTELWTSQPTDGPAHPETHRFDGDTLVFHAFSSSTLDPYVGPIYAWRPGWPEPRQLSQGTRAYTCGAHFGAELALCIEDLTDVAPLQFNLTAGPLGGLKTMARITPTRPGTQSSQWSVTLTRAGDHVVFSTGGPAREQTEALYVVRTADIAGAATITPTKVADNISRWRLSVDGKQIFYLRNYNYSTEGDPSGNLMVADFPSLMNERMLAAKVGLFQVLSDGTETNRGLGMFQDVVINKGNYRIMRDVAMPAALATVATGVSSITLSRNLDYAWFSKEIDVNVGLTDAWIARTDGTGTPCQLTSSIQGALFGSPFTPNSRMVLWVDRVDTTDGVGEGWYSPVEGCGAASRKKFADRIDYWFADGNEWLVYSDGGVFQTSDLKVAPTPGGNTIGAPTVVQQSISRLFGIVPGFQALLFSISGSAGSDGLYAIPRSAFAGN
jgi:hypothetical protein